MPNSKLFTLANFALLVSIAGTIVLGFYPDAHAQFCGYRPLPINQEGP